MFISLFFKVNSYFLASHLIFFDALGFLYVTNKFPSRSLPPKKKKKIYEIIKQNQSWGWSSLNTSNSLGLKHTLHLKNYLHHITLAPNLTFSQIANVIYCVLLHKMI